MFGADGFWGIDSNTWTWIGGIVTAILSGLGYAIRTGWISIKETAADLIGTHREFLTEMRENDKKRIDILEAMSTESARKTKVLENLEDQQALILKDTNEIATDIAIIKDRQILRGDSGQFPKLEK